MFLALLLRSYVLKSISLRLSAYLAEESANGTNSFMDKALASATFLRNMLLDDSGAVFVSINLTDCTRLSQDKSEVAAGYAMQAWSIVADVTGDPQWRELYVNSRSFGRLLM
jgi:hypothetical protein